MSRISKRPFTTRCRELEHQVSKLAAPITLEGKTVKKIAYEPQTMGKWENLICRTSDERARPRSPENRRYMEYKSAERTIHPEKNEEKPKPMGKKIIVREQSPENPGRLLNLINKTLSEEEYNKKYARKKFPQKSETTYDKDPEVRRYYK